MNHTNHTPLKAFQLFIKRCLHEVAGVAAVEFAIIVPLIMIPLYVGLVDISTAFMAKKRVESAALQTGDIVAQYENLTTSDLSVFVDAARSTIYPMPLVKASTNEYLFGITYTVVKLDATGGSVVWSFGDAPLDSGNRVTIPDNFIELYKAGRVVDLVMTTGTYKYNSIILGFLKETGLSPYYNLSSTYYYKPRVGDTVNKLN